MKRTANGATKRHRVRLQAAALAFVPAAYGFVWYVLGAPALLLGLYVALGLALAGARLWFGRARPPAVAEPAPEPPAPPPISPAPLVRRVPPAPPAPPVPPARAAARPAEMDPPAQAAARPQAIGYVCVPALTDGELERQVATVRACAAEQDLDLVAVVHDVDGAGRDQRPSLAWALEQIADCKADALVVARLHDLSANVANLPPLLTWFNDVRRRLIAIDLSLDTATDGGQLAAQAIAGIGEWEHDRISERTRRGLEAARAGGNGNGRTSVAHVPELQERIAGMRASGMTLQAIADRLNAEQVPTLRGGAMWRPSSVQRATGYRRPSSSRGIEIPKADR